MSKSVFIVGYYGFGNTGDEAILISMVAHLRELQPDLQITATSATPEKTAAACGIESILWSDAYAMQEAVRRADLVLIGGGGIFHDYWGIDPDVVLTDDHWGISFYVGPAAIAAVYDKPCMLYAVGVGPLFSEHSRRFLKAIASSAAAITVRDPGSKQLLESIGVEAARVVVTADPAFGFPSIGQPAAASHSKSGQLRVGVALRQWDVGVDPKFWEPEVAAGLDRFLEEREGSLVFIPFQCLKDIGEDDPLIATRVQSYMKHKDRTSILAADLAPQETYAALADCDLVVGMRLHSMILSMAAVVPVVAISYDAKVDEAMKLAGLQEFKIDIGAVESSLLARRMHDALVERAPARIEGLENAARRNARIAVEIMDIQAAQSPIPAELADLLGRGIRAQLNDSRNLRIENDRLFHEVEYYRQACSVQEAKQATHAARILELEEEQRGLLIETGRSLAELAKVRDVAAENGAIWQNERRALETRRDELASQLTHSEYEAGRLEADLEQVRLNLAEKDRQIVEREKAIARIEEELGTSRDEAAGYQTLQQSLQAQIADLEAARSEHHAALASAEMHRDNERARRVEISGRLRMAENLRAAAVTGLDQFQKRFYSDLDAYRSQRAWKVMLAVRKGYTLVTRRGWLAFLRWALALPVGGPGPLEEYDLRFPDVWNYMPERLEASTEVLPKEELSSPWSTELPSLRTPALKKLSDLIVQRSYDLVILPVFDFEFRFQRPQQIAARFAREGHRVFWISPTRFLPLDSIEAYIAIPLRENLWEVHLRGAPPDLYGGDLTPEQAAHYASSLEKLYTDFHIAESCALLQFPFWRKAGLMLRERFGARLAYDCMDDWRNWTAEPRISDFSLSEEDRLLRDCDVLIVSAHEFYERHKSEGLDPILVRNGADFDFFSSPRTNELLEEVPEPIVGYYGAIADWFDLDLVEKVAASRPGYTFVLIGQVHEVDATRLLALPNVRMLGEKNYREIPLFLSHFDVCLIPFKLNNLTKAVDPVKLYEFLSQGKPVVATDMAELPKAADLLYIGHGPEDFAAKIDLAIRESAAPDSERKQQARIGYARENTWAARVRDIDTAISKRFPMASILVVTHNCEEFIEPCLDSIAKNTSWPNYEVILVDNHSKDRTRTIAEQYAKSDRRVRLFCQDQNLGFAGGSNLAAGLAVGEYLVYLNPDTIVTPGWLGRLIRHCEADSTIGAVAAVTNFSGNETKVPFAYGNVLDMQEFALELAAEKANLSIDIPMAPLYCVVVPRAVHEAVGELDSSFQVGMFEDDDFSYRLKRAGYRVIAAEDCFIHHFGNGSFSKVPSKESIRIFEANRQRFDAKWNVTWQPHTVRPGLRPPSEDRRLTPEQFLTVSGVDTRPDSNRLLLRKLDPARVAAREAFNRQADGQSALVIDCEHATPGTVAVMGSKMLVTTYGNESFLSALVPPELYSRAGFYPVYLLNDFGESNSMEFVIEAPGIAPMNLLGVNGKAGRQSPATASLVALQPSSTVAGQGFNAQPDGQSALVIDCADATPDTVIVMGSAVLATSFGSENLLSGLVPNELYSKPGVHAVYLVNDLGESDRLDFVVEAGSSEKRRRRASVTSSR